MPKASDNAVSGGHSSFRFIVVGGLAAAFYLVATYLGIRAGFPVAQTCAAAYLVAFVLAYLGQRHFVFRSRSPARRSLPRYAALQLGCAAASAGAAHALAMVPSASPAVISFGSMLVAGLLGYVGSSRWVFAGRGAQ